MGYSAKRINNLKRKYAKYAPYIKAGARAIKKARQGSHPNWKGMNTNLASKGPITTQRDVKVWKKKKVSKKQRKWKNFVRKVDNAVHFTHELCHFMETTSTVILSQSLSGRSIQNPFISGNLSGLELDFRLGCYRRNFVGMSRMFNDIRLQADTITSTLVAAKKTGGLIFDKLYLKSSSMTFSLINSSAEAAAGDAQNIFVDIYECIANKTMDVSEDRYHSAYGAWSECLLEGTTPGGATGLATPTFSKNLTGTSGCTPYMAPNFGQYWKILKKTRILMGPGEKINYTMNGPRGWMQGDWVTGEADRVQKGKVKDLIIIVNPTFNSPSLNILTQLCRMQWTKSYYLGTDLPGKDAPISGTYIY